MIRVIRVLSTKIFSRFIRKNRISDDALCHAVARVARGLVDADLGSGLVKQRIARPGQGKSGGFRAILVFRSQAFTCFLYGFAKSDQDNIDDADLKLLRKLAAEMLRYSKEEIEILVADGNLIEVNCHAEALS